MQQYNTKAEQNLSETAVSEQFVFQGPVIAFIAGLAAGVGIAKVRIHNDRLQVLHPLDELLMALFEFLQLADDGIALRGRPAGKDGIADELYYFQDDKTADSENGNDGYDRKQYIV